MAINSIDYSGTKSVMAFKAACSLLGWNQKDFAEKASLSLSTIQRLEKDLSSLRMDSYMNILRIFKEHGIDLSITNDENITIVVSRIAIEKVDKDLKNAS
jgi:transcriptional regulator with XRE-family HTH domain